MCLTLSICSLVGDTWVVSTLWWITLLCTLIFLIIPGFHLSESVPGSGVARPYGNLNWTLKVKKTSRRKHGLMPREGTLLHPSHSLPLDLSRTMLHVHHDDHHLDQSQCPWRCDSVSPSMTDTAFLPHSLVPPGPGHPRSFHGWVTTPCLCHWVVLKSKE